MSDDDELAKDLGLASALAIGIGTMIGAGIFVLPGVAAQAAGPVVVVSFAIGGLIAMINALAVSELGTAMPRAGGGYYYVNRGLGPLFGSITGMGDWMGLAFASAFYCIGFGGYLADDLLAGTMFALPTLDLGVLVLTDIQLGAVIAGIIFVGVNYIGAKETGGVQTVIVILLLAILTIFALVGWFSFDWGTLTTDGWAPTALGYGAILPATGLVFVSFLGYAKIATVAEEMKNPGRNLPIAVVGSVAVVTVIYTILVALMVGIVPWDVLDDSVPVSQVAAIAFEGVPVLGAVGVTLVTVAALLATASSANASILSSARINFAMGRDRIVTNWLNEIHPSFATPYRSILVTGGMILLFIVTLGQDLAILATAASVLHLIVYALMNLALIAFREADVPEYDPDFTVPLYPLTPILGATFSLGLIYFIQWEAQVLSLLFVVGAVGWYFLYARGETEQAGAVERYVLDRAEEMPDLAVSAAETTVPEAAAEYRVMVPMANPETSEELVAIGSVLADHNDGTVHPVHVVEIPHQTALEHGAEQLDRLEREESEALLERARGVAGEYGADVETHRVFSHQAFAEVFDAARRLDADAVVMGWSPQRPWSRRLRGGLEDRTHDLPCDFLVLRDRGFDASRVLLPTAGGEDSDLSAEAAKAFRDVLGAEVSVLHVVDEDTDRARAMAFIGEWADEHGLGDANLLVETDGDVEAAIERAAADHTLVLVGATREGLLSRLASGSLAFDVIERLDTSVLLSERPRERTILERLFGRTREVIDADSSDDTEKSVDTEEGDDIDGATDTEESTDTEVSTDTEDSTDD